MNKIQSSLSNMVIVLVGLAVVVGGLLAWVNQVTAGPIARKADMTLADGICHVMGTGTLTVVANDTAKETVDGKELSFVIHKAADKSGNPLGAAVESTTAGFGGDLKVLVGFDLQGNILGYTILQSAETPGLGAKADKWFQKDGKGDIIGMNPGHGALSVSKDGGKVDAITASTITSRAFLRCINQAYQAYKGNGENRPADAPSGQNAAEATTGASKQATKHTSVSPTGADTVTGATAHQTKGHADGRKQRK